MEYIDVYTISNEEIVDEEVTIENLSVEALSLANESEGLASTAEELAELTEEISLESEDFAAAAEELAEDAESLVEFSGDAEDLALRAEELAEDAEFLSLQAEELATEAEELATEAEELATEAEELATEAEELATEAEEIADEEVVDEEVVDENIANEETVEFVDVANEEVVDENIANEETVEFVDVANQEVDNGGDTILGGAANDFLEGGDGIDSMRGAEGNDTLIGGGGADSLFGDEGNDVLDGGIGNDIYYGNLGDDTLIGGEGADAFAFLLPDSFTEANDENIIENFDPNSDVIRLIQYGLETDGVEGVSESEFSALLERVTIEAVDGGTRITGSGEGGQLGTGSEGTIFLPGISPEQLTSAQFEFADTIDGVEIGNRGAIAPAQADDVIEDNIAGTDGVNTFEFEQPENSAIGDFGVRDSFAFRGNTSEATLLNDLNGRVTTIDLEDNRGQDSDALGQSIIFDDGNFNLDSDISDITNDVSEFA